MVFFKRPTPFSSQSAATTIIRITTTRRSRRTTTRRSTTRTIRSIKTTATTSTTPHHLLYLTTLLSIILLMVCAPAPTQAGPLVASGTNIEYKRYCSNTLSDAIRLICGGRFNSLARKFPDSVGSGSFRPSALKRLANGDDGIFYRPMHTGPIHECCRRPCGYSELKMYCAPD